MTSSSKVVQCSTPRSTMEAVSLIPIRPSSLFIQKCGNVAGDLTGLLQMPFPVSGSGSIVQDAQLEPVYPSNFDFVHFSEPILVLGTVPNHFFPFGDVESIDLTFQASFEYDIEVTASETFSQQHTVVASVALLSSDTSFDLSSSEVDGSGPYSFATDTTFNQAVDFVVEQLPPGDTVLNFRANDDIYLSVVAGSPGYIGTPPDDLVLTGSAFFQYWWAISIVAVHFVDGTSVPVVQQPTSSSVLSNCGALIRP